MTTGQGLHPSRVRALLVLTLAVLLAVVPDAGASGAEGSRWAPATEATIHPGVQMLTDGAECTGNFVFVDRRRRTYLGYAAHCAAKESGVSGCRARALPIGSRVRFARGGAPGADGRTVGRGRLAYSSWLTMTERGLRDPARCRHNDFALVRVGRAHVGKVNPSVPFWGGPVGLDRRGPAAGEDVYSYGASELRAGLSGLAPKQGTLLGTSARGWAHEMYFATPGVPGDSGSAVLGPTGRAASVVTTVEVAPRAGVNGGVDLHRALRFARRHAGIAGLRLVPGTEPFRTLG